jgi:hypothetical protein
MSEQEKQLVFKISNFVLLKIMNSKSNVVDYGTVAKFMNVPIDIIRTAARQICSCLLNNSNVDDVDCIDNEAFDVILKNRIVRI